MIGITRPDGSILRVEFVHHDYPGGKDLGKLTPTRYHTECTLRLHNIPTAAPGLVLLLGHGNSFCSVLERLQPFQSVRANGRIRAMKRALTDAGDMITKQEFHDLFEVYSKRTKGKLARRMQEQNVARKATLSPSTETA